MQEMLEHAGYEIVPFQEGADIYVINTCTVTNIADRKSRQMLHRARKMNPDAVVVAAGCYVQAQAEKQVIDPCIDIVLGNNKKQDLLTALQAYEEAHGDLREVIDINHTKEYENLHLTKQGSIREHISRCRMAATSFVLTVLSRMREEESEAGQKKM